MVCLAIFIAQAQTLILMIRWIAALWGVMKTEWESYYGEYKYVPDGRLQATGKGQAHQKAMLKVAFTRDMNGGHPENSDASWPKSDIDGRVAHWLMTVLLGRNVVVSRESSLAPESPKTRQRAIKLTVDRLWIREYPEQRDA